MLHPNEIVDEPRVEASRSEADNNADLEHLRKLLLGTEYQDLLHLQREFSSHSSSSEKISQVISEAIAMRSAQDDSVSQALVPSVEDAIRSSAKRDPKRLANALFPVMGPAIREAVSDAINGMMQQVNQLMENSFSARSIKWRIDAFRTKRSFAEVMLSETFVYQVEQVFLIHRESSLLISHLTSANAIVKDPDMVSSMLTVVTDFVKDSFVVDKQQNVKSIKFGQLNLLFEAGPHAIVVAAVRGLIPVELQVRIREQVEELHRQFGSQLEAYKGDAGQFPDTYEQLNRCLLSEKKDGDSTNAQATTNAGDENKVPWGMIAVACLLVLLPIAWWLFSKFEHNQWHEIVNKLQAESGIVILDHRKLDGEYIVHGMRDPLAKDPADVVATSGDFDKPIKWNMQSYYSSEAVIVKKRILKTLKPPPSVSVNYQNGQLTLQGQAEPDWIASLTNKLPLLWGVSNVNTAQLSEIENVQQIIQALITSIEDIIIEFAPGSSELSYHHLSALEYLHEQLNVLEAYTAKAGQTFKLGVLGFADRSGTSGANILISEQRARNVHDALYEKGVNIEDLLAKGLGSFEVQAEFNKDLSCESQRCVAFEVYLN